MKKRVKNEVNESKAKDTLIRIRRWWATEHSKKGGEIIMVELEDSRLGLLHVNFEKAITEDDYRYKLDTYKGETNSQESVQLDCPASQIVMPLSLRKHIFRATLQSMLDDVLCAIDNDLYPECPILHVYVSANNLLPKWMNEEALLSFADDVENLANTEGLCTDDDDDDGTKIPKRLRKMVGMYRQLWPDDKFYEESDDED